MTHRRPQIAVVNHSTGLPQAEVGAVMRAIQHQIDYHFEPHWGASATLQVVVETPAGHIAPKGLGDAQGEVTADGHMVAQIVASEIPAGAWLLVLADDSDQAGALGYHEIDPKAVPLGYVFAKTDEKYGLSWSVTASHEILEMLGDPMANLMAQVRDDGTALAYETADAVEADDLGYTIHDGITGQDVLVSDFVFPNWFVPGSLGPWDYEEHCQQAMHLLPGGYIGVFHPGKGWTQVTADKSPRHQNGPRFRARKEGHGLPEKTELPAWVDETH